MKEKSVISVILTTYNSNFNYLKRCIQSILLQTYKNFELIIVDDGSENGTQEFLQDFCRFRNNIHLFLMNNMGVSGARNIGVYNSIGDYITFVDHDDWLEPEMLACMISKATADNADYVVCANYENYNGKQSIDTIYEEDVVLSDPHSLSTFVHKSPNKNTVFSYPQFFHCAWGMLIRAEIVKKTLYDENIRIAEDIEWASRVFTHIKCVSYINRPLYHYRCLNNSSSHRSPILDFIPAFEKIENNLKTKENLLPNMYLLFALMLYQRLPAYTTAKDLKSIYGCTVISKTCQEVQLRHLSFGIRLCILLLSKQRFKCSAVVNCICKFKEHFFHKYVSG